MPALHSSASDAAVIPPTLPQHWQYKPLGYVTEILTGFAFPSESFDMEEGIPLVRGDNVTEGVLRWGDKARFWPAVDESLRRFVLQSGDVLIGMDGSKVGKNYAIVTDKDPQMLLVQRVARLRATGALLPRFVYRLIGSPLFRNWVDIVRTDPAIPHISPHDIHSFKVPVPPLEEQERLLHFIDRETVRIDALIEKKTRFIELLREKRQALITQAVTQGLDPSVPMKDSGVDWLGQVPAHWAIKPLKLLARFLSGGTPSKENRAFWDGAVPWASAKDLKTERLADTQDHLTEVAIMSGAAEMIAPGAVLVVVRGMILARTFPVTLTTAAMAINQDLKALVPAAGITPEFLAWLLRGTSALTLSRLEEAAHGTKALRMESWVDLRLPVPPEEEQTLLCADLERRLAQIDMVIDRTARSTELLSERRSALITAAVTGQIDLREAA